MTQSELTFDGETFEHDRDSVRLSRQLYSVLDLMRDGKWRTLREIATKTNNPESSISARLRDLRKPRFGAHTVEREYVNQGLYRYRLILNEDKLC